MIIDTSAIVAILLRESKLDEFSEIIEAASNRLICAVNWYECGIVVRRHKGAAALNLADCCAYALAKAEGMPLLFKGNDFLQTDIPSACAIWRHR